MKCPNMKCHPERSSRFAKRSSYVVEEPALSEAEGTPTSPTPSAKCQGVLPKTRVERTLLSAAYDSDFFDSLPDPSIPCPENKKIRANFPADYITVSAPKRRVPHPSFFEGWDSAPTARDQASG